MKVGDSTVIEVRVTLDEAQFSKLASRISASGKVETGRGEFTHDLRASLQSNGFDIQPPGEQPHKVLPNRDVQWTWAIEAKKAGTFPIVLRIASDLGNGQVLSSFTKTILVKAVPQSSTAAVKDFILKNWEKLLTVVLIPLGLAVWRWMAKRKTPSSLTNDDPSVVK